MLTATHSILRLASAGLLTCVFACSSGSASENIGSSKSAVTASSIASIALANVGAGACSANSEGGSAFASSCTGNGGQPEYWCADFARWVWGAAGVNTAGLSAAAGSFYVYGQNNGTLESSPSVGDAVVFDYHGGGSADHVAIVVQVNGDGSIETVSGDWGGDSGSEAQFSSTSHVVFNAPAYGSAVGSQPGIMGMTISGFVAPAGGFTAPAPALPPPAAFQLFTGDFNGDGKTDELFYFMGDGNWWMGLSDGTNLSWHLAANTSSFGNLLDGSKWFFQGDFNGDGKIDVGFYFKGDSNWWIGLSDGTKLDWQLASNTTGFGDLLDFNAAFFTGDFNGDGKTDVAFYHPADSNWWMGLSTGSTLSWQFAGNTDGFGNLAAAGSRFFTGDFNGDGKTDVTFYHPSDGNWFFGLSNGSALGWVAAGNTTGFGDILGSTYSVFQGDFNGDGKEDVAFYYSGDSNWWLGLSNGSTLDWQEGGNTAGFGDLDDGSSWFFQGDFNGDKKQDVLFYHHTDSNWWLGRSSGTTIGPWHLAGNTTGFGNLMNGSMEFFQGDYNGDGKSDVLFYSSGDSNWWMGLSDGTDVNWHLAGNTAGFGNLLSLQ